MTLLKHVLLTVLSPVLPGLVLLCYTKTLKFAGFGSFLYSLTLFDIKSDLAILFILDMISKGNVFCVLSLVFGLIEFT